MIDWKLLLNNLGVEDREIVFTYLFLFSRFEYALKKCKYTHRENNGVSANWECFIKNVKEDFNKDRTEELSDSVTCLLDNPPQAQILDENGNLVFKRHVSTDQGPVPLRLYNCLRIVRNNLFHGGKYPGNPVSDTARDKKLLQCCITILNDFIQLDSSINFAFLETGSKK